MTLAQAIALGIIQGLTEFLPVSSSGHLVIFQHLFGLKEPELIFDVIVHVGTLAAVCAYFFKDIRDIIRAVFKWARDKWWLAKNVTAGPEVRMAALIAVGSVPTAAAGLALHGAAEILFSSVLLVGAALAFTGVWMWFTRGRDAQGSGISRLTVLRAILIGTAQGVAVIPGVSRSGATIAASLYLGLDRETAARFSFLLSIPAIAGAAVLSLTGSQAAGTADITAILAGGAAAGMVGYLALWLLVWLVKKGRLFAFAPYCWHVAGIILMTAW